MAILLPRPISLVPVAGPISPAFIFGYFVTVEGGPFLSSSDQHPSAVWNAIAALVSSGLPRVVSLPTLLLLSSHLPRL